MFMTINVLVSVSPRENFVMEAAMLKINKRCTVNEISIISVSSCDRCRLHQCIISHHLEHVDDVLVFISRDTIYQFLDVPDKIEYLTNEITPAILCTKV